MILAIVFASQSFAQSFDFKYETISISIKSAKITGNELKIELIANSSDDNAELLIPFTDIIITDTLDYNYALKNAHFGRKPVNFRGITKNVIHKNIPLNIGLSFDLSNKKATGIKSLTFPARINGENEEFIVAFSNIPIGFSLPNAYPDSKEIVKFEPKTILLAPNVTLKISRFRIIGDELRYDLILENKSEMIYKSNISVDDSRLIDALGNEYDIISIILDEQKGGKNNIITNEVPPNYLIHGNLTVICEDAFQLNTMKLIELNINNKNFSVENVGFSR